MEAISKARESTDIEPNLRDYEQYRLEFSWEKARSELDGLPAGAGLNIAHEAIERHAGNKERANHSAIRWIGKGGETIDFSYSDLSRETNKFANLLKNLGVGKGDRVFTLLGRVPELYMTALGTLKNRSVFCPLFSAFGPEPIRSRAEIGGAKVLVTNASLYKLKVEGIRSELPNLEHVLIVGEPEDQKEFSDTLHFQTLMDEAGDEFTIAPTDPEDMALLHFTSGTTGKPKGVIHVHEAVLSHHITGKLALDLHPEDVFWCTADPGWVTGTSYGIIAPLTNGITSIIDEEEFDAARWYQNLQDHKVNVWYTAPTAIRMLMKAGTDIVKDFDLSNLRFLASVGEPLNPEAVIWSEKVFGRPFHDNWWQSETGGIMIANFASVDIKPGSMGKPLPGIEAEIVSENENGEIEIVEEPNTPGELALRTDFPSLFRGYLDQPQKYDKCFANGFYLTGDLAQKDADGYFRFVGRKDDLIKTSGHLVGPFEVESALLEHDAVAEAGVIGKPHPLAGQIIKAFVSLNKGIEPNNKLKREIMGHARKKLGAVVAPKEIDFLSSLPKTRSGKIMRRLLKARELGLPEGDISTLETS
ncbi:MAG: acetate--CoA ligase [Pyrinomonadaceae bacterium]|nr:acetate--CoA ligase [Pyrinomonadaceae bacterium]